jgi:hypothetical protein
MISCHTGGKTGNIWLDGQPKDLLYFTAADRYTCYTSAHKPYRFTTYDGRSIRFDGDCKYLLSGTQTDNGFSSVPQFQIYLKKEQGGRNIAYVEIILGDNIENINIRILAGNIIQVCNVCLSILINTLG